VIREPARVRLELESHPENVVIVRAALAGIADAAGLDDEYASDLKTAVSEACNNVSLHAYEQSGLMIVDIAVTHDGVSVIVGDRGRGIRRVMANEDRMGLGLAVISALADKAEFANSDAGGTEVRMWFGRETGLTTAPSAHQAAVELAAEKLRMELTLTGDVVAWCSPVDVMRFVVGRLIRTIAAGSHFSLTRVTELRAVNEAVAEYAELAADGGVGVAVSGSSRRLVLTGGPFSPPSSTAEPAESDGRSTDELESRREAIAGMVDAIDTESYRDKELLRLVLLDETREAG